MTAANCLAIFMLGAMVIYSLLAGADFGAGFWDLWCDGPRAAAQRKLIEQAIEPVWETNHVWLILLVVLMFAGFPPAFSAIGISLAIPLFLVLLGIVLRGASYVFRSYSVSGPRMQLRWGRVFSISSSITPVFLGIIIGAVSSDNFPPPGDLGSSGYFEPWWRAMPICVGLLSLSLFSYLAACYLIVETTDAQLQEDFRLRALLSGAASVGLGVTTLVMSNYDAVGIRDRLFESTAVCLIHLTAIAVAAAAFLSLRHRRYRMARRLAAIQVSLIILGWGRAQYPFLVRPNLTIAANAAPENVQVDLIIACLAGCAVLFPSLALLFYVFKGQRNLLAPSAPTGEAA